MHRSNRTPSSLSQSTSGKIPSSRSNKRILWFTLLFSGTISLATLAQNPSFGGKEFRHVWTDGQVPEGVNSGVTLTEAVLTQTGIYLFSDFSPQGVYFLTDDGVKSVAVRDQENFNGLTRFLPLGVIDERDLLFVPVAINNLHPVYRHGAEGLQAQEEPTAEQAIGQYVDGHMIYSTFSTKRGTEVWSYHLGQAPERIYSNDNLPDLNPHLDYDGNSIFLTTGSQDADMAIWIHRPDGQVKKVIQHGDALPGSEGTFRGFASTQGAFADSGKIYFIAQSNEPAPFAPDHLLISSNGDTTEPILKRGQEVPGSPGVTLNGFEVAQIEGGRIWFVASLSTGGKVLFRIEDGEWTSVISTAESVGGRTPIGMRAFRRGALGENLIVQLTFLGNNFRPINELYTNAPLEGLPTLAPESKPQLKVAFAPNGQLQLSAEGMPGTSVILEASNNLGQWESLGAPQTIQDGESAAWLLPAEGSARFFRTVNASSAP